MGSQGGVEGGRAEGTAGMPETGPLGLRAYRVGWLVGQVTECCSQSSPRCPWTADPTDPGRLTPLTLDVYPHCSWQLEGGGDPDPILHAGSSAIKPAG